MTESTTPVGLGWLPDLRSIKEYTIENAKVKPLLAKVKGAGTKAPAMLAASVDLRPWFSRSRTSSASARARPMQGWA
jgi:transposase